MARAAVGQHPMKTRSVLAAAKARRTGMRSIRPIGAPAPPPAAHGEVGNGPMEATAKGWGEAAHRVRKVPGRSERSVRNDR